MKVFVLWLHMLINVPGVGLQSYKVLPHPVQFDTLPQCEAAAEQWAADRLSEVDNPEGYAIVHKCEEHQVAGGAAHFENQTSMM